jgi:hypothetical protein
MYRYRLQINWEIKKKIEQPISLLSSQATNQQVYEPSMQLGARLVSVSDNESSRHQIGIRQQE